MSFPEVIGAYNDCFDHFDKALAAAKGIRVEFHDYGGAMMFSMRMQQARSLQRKESRRMYERDHPLYDKSEYDCLMVRKPRAGHEDNWWVHIERPNSSVKSVEELD